PSANQCVSSAAYDGYKRQTGTCELYGFQFQGAEENQLLQPHSCPVIAAGQGKEVIKTLFNELSVILPQSKNSQTS
ncbi:hypothetical protein DV966_13505, partial [Staphylococcus pseudintermedius]